MGKRDYRALTANQHREIVATHRRHETGNPLVDELMQANNDLHELVADLLDARTEAVLLINHLRDMHPSNAVGDVWIDAVEVAQIETRIDRFDKLLITIGCPRSQPGPLERMGR